MAKGEGEVAEGLLRELCDFARRVGDKPAYTLNGKQIADIIITAEQLAKHLAQLQSALRAAREDAARLDWLTYKNMDHINRTSLAPQFIAHDEQHHLHLVDTIREAIDLARGVSCCARWT